jgi:hypothetical protein
MVFFELKKITQTNLTRKLCSNFYLKYYMQYEPYLISNELFELSRKLQCVSEKLIYHNLGFESNENC